MASLEIATIEDLNRVRYTLDGNYVLMNDLDFNEDNSYINPTANKAIYTPNDMADITMATNAGFRPIGTNANSFTGTFDGNGFTISNLYINRTAVQTA